MKSPVLVRVTEAVINEPELRAFVADDAAGAVVIFSGTARNHSPGRTGVTHLDYETYPEKVEGAIEEIVEETRTKWDVLKVAVVHRSGRVDIGEPAVTVAVSAAHRAAAFDAARYLIDELKSRVPIWKQEHWAGGSEWIEGA